MKNQIYTHYFQDQLRKNLLYIANILIKSQIYVNNPISLIEKNLLYMVELIIYNQIYTWNLTRSGSEKFVIQVYYKDIKFVKLLASFFFILSLEQKAKFYF